MMTPNPMVGWEMDFLTALQDAQGRCTRSQAVTIIRTIAAQRYRTLATRVQAAGAEKLLTQLADPERRMIQLTRTMVEMDIGGETALQQRARREHDRRVTKLKQRARR